jgi:hypothetical protein
MPRELDRDDAQKCREGTEAWERVKKSWEDWLKIGEAYLIGRKWAMQVANTNQPLGRGYNTAFGGWMERYHFSDMKSGDRTNLFHVMDNLPEIVRWRREVLEPQGLQYTYNHPNSVWRQYQAWLKRQQRQSDNGQPAAAPTTQRSLVAKITELRRELEQANARLAEVTEERDHARDTRVAAEGNTSEDNTSKVKIGLDALVTASKHVAAFINVLPEDVIYAKQDLEQVIECLQALNKHMSKRRTAQKQGAKQKTTTTRQQGSMTRNDLARLLDGPGNPEDADAHGLTPLPESDDDAES